MLTINSRTDIETYVDDTHADFCECGLRDAIVAAIQGADHPRYGDDWSAWLEENIEVLRDKVNAESWGELPSAVVIGHGAFELDCYGDHDQLATTDLTAYQGAVYNETLSEFDDAWAVSIMFFSPDTMASFDRDSRHDDAVVQWWSN